MPKHVARGELVLMIVLYPDSNVTSSKSLETFGMECTRRTNMTQMKMENPNSPKVLMHRSMLWRALYKVKLFSIG